MQIGVWRFSGLVAWLMWLFVHIIMLIEPRHRVMVLREWLWSYFTRERNALLITSDAKSITTTLKSDEVKFKA